MNQPPNGWHCNVYGDRYQIDELYGVVIYHADCAELVVGGYIGEPAGRDQKMIEDFKAQGVVGVYIKEN